MEKDMEKLVKILTDIRPDVDFTAETALIDDGIIESLDIVAIVTGIIDEFDVEISVDDLLPENFNSVEAILAMIHDKQS